MLELAHLVVTVVWVIDLILSPVVFMQAVGAAVAAGTTLFALAVMVALSLASVFALIVFVVIAALFVRMAGAR